MNMKIKSSFAWDGGRTAEAGFSLLELLAVISIIGLLANIIVVTASSAREKARIAHTLVAIDEIKKSISIYLIDVGDYPPNCMVESSCSASTDPFLNSLGMPGWNGPYLGLWNLAHPWAGQIGFENGSLAQSPTDWDGDGTYDYGIFLNDDRPGTSINDNGGQVPSNVLQRIDEILDDGNLATGNVRGNGGGWPGQETGAGEMCIKILL